MPTFEQIAQDVREICAQKFPELTLDTTRKFPIHDGRTFCVSYKNDDYVAIIFWCAYCDLSMKRVRGTPCIEFRHGHLGEFEWLGWIEYEIREELAFKYDAKIIEDSDPNKIEEPKVGRYKNYMEYLVRGRWKEIEENKGWKDYVNEILDRCKESLPEDIKYLVGGPIS